MAKIIGLTGGIAMGKSTVSAHLKEKGFTVIDADQIVHDLQKKGGALYEILVSELGEEILNPTSGEIDRKALSAMAFGDLEILAKFSKIQKPLIDKTLIEEIEKARSGEKTTFFDCALLFERKFNKFCDEVWALYTSPEVQIERLMARNNLSRKEALSRIKSQMKSFQRNVFSNKIIENNGTREELLEKVDALIADL